METTEFFFFTPTSNKQYIQTPQKEQTTEVGTEINICSTRAKSVSTEASKKVQKTVHFYSQDAEVLLHSQAVSYKGLTLFNPRATKRGPFVNSLTRPTPNIALACYIASQGYAQRLRA